MRSAVPVHQLDQIHAHPLHQLPAPGVRLALADRSAHLIRQVPAMEGQPLVVPVNHDLPEKRGLAADAVHHVCVHPLLLALLAHILQILQIFLVQAHRARKRHDRVQRQQPAPGVPHDHRVRKRHRARILGHGVGHFHAPAADRPAYPPKNHAQFARVRSLGEEMHQVFRGVQKPAPSQGHPQPRAQGLDRSGSAAHDRQKLGGVLFQRSTPRGQAHQRRFRAEHLRYQAEA